MVQTPAKTLTLEEFLKLPEIKPSSEYVDGKIIQKPMPQGKHSVVQGELVRAVNAVVKPQLLSLSQNCAVRLANDRLSQTLRFLPGTEFQPMPTQRSRMFLEQLQTGQLGVAEIVMLDLTS